MARGGFPGGFGGRGAGGLNNIMKQAQKMQRDMEKAQEELENTVIEASAGGGAVTVVLNGNKIFQEININPEVVDPDDVEMLQDLVLAAVNEGLRKADELKEEKFGSISGGLGGLF
jgi:DNA-binding YbaB/EbfC family protein